MLFEKQTPSVPAGTVLKLLKTAARIAKAVLFRLSYLVPRNKNLIIFGAGNGMLFSDNPRYIFLKALSDKDVKAIWITRNREVYRKMTGDGLPCLMMFSLKGLMVQLRAYAGIVSHSPFYDFALGMVGGAKIINTWHGVGLKKVYYANKSSRDYRRYHHKKCYIRALQRAVVGIFSFRDYYVISTSPAVTSYYPETFMLPGNKVLELGQARNDVFFDDSLDDKDFPESFKKQKIITYMPTHRLNGNVPIDIESIFDLKKLNDLCEKNDCLFLIKMHFYSSDKARELSARIINVGAMDIDTQTLLKYTDILITDYSSCYTDYLLLDKPVLFYNYDYNEYISSDREMYFEYEDVTPGPKLTSFNELMEELRLTLDGRDAYREERRRVLNIFYSEENQGMTAEKQWSYIKENIIGK